MAAAEDVVRQVVYEPRKQFIEFHHRDKRWGYIVAHRSAGKTVACVNELVTRGLATSKTKARYAYIAPFREQAKTVAWEYLKTYAACVVRDPATDFRESDLSVKLFNGSTIRLFGADNPNALRGMHLDGVVMDEYADMKPSLWGEVIRPTLSNRNGWAVFIGTPRGRNAFYTLIHGDSEHKGANNDPEWFCLTLKASETGILSPAELEDARSRMTPNQYEQEYECSFEAAVIGAVYAKELKHAKIETVPYDGSKLVFTAWDIGIGDPTSIWFFQVIAKEVRLIDFFEDEGESAAYYAGILRGRGYNYDTAFLPHDARNEQSATGLTFKEVLEDNGFRCNIVDKLSLEEGISAARMLLPRCLFDSTKCAVGLEAMRNYRWDYNQRMGELKAMPVHNWASHPADAFRYLAVSFKKKIEHPQQWRGPIAYPKLAYV